MFLGQNLEQAEAMSESHNEPARHLWMNRVECRLGPGCSQSIKMRYKKESLTMTQGSSLAASSCQGPWATSEVSTGLNLATLEWIDVTQHSPSNDEL
jgi:hypothetical protein